MGKIDIKKWHDFEISRLFTIKSPKARRISEYIEGDVPYVSSGAINNGVVSYLEPKNEDDIEKGNCITVSPLDGSAFYQECDFLGRGGAGSAISLLYNDNLDKYNSLFIATIIKLASEKFDYSDALTGTNLYTLKIKLPVLTNKHGSPVIDKEKIYNEKGLIPDWDGMSKQIKSLEVPVLNKLEILKELSF
ncbi:restriction endonuclease subunit S [Streptococcus hyovaginalis]